MGCKDQSLGRIWNASRLRANLFLNVTPNSLLAENDILLIFLDHKCIVSENSHRVNEACSRRWECAIAKVCKLSETQFLPRGTNFFVGIIVSNDDAGDCSKKSANFGQIVFESLLHFLAIFVE